MKPRRESQVSLNRKMLPGISGGLDLKCSCTLLVLTGKGENELLQAFQRVADALSISGIPRSQPPVSMVCQHVRCNAQAFEI